MSVTGQEQGRAERPGPASRTQRTPSERRQGRFTTAWGKPALLLIGIGLLALVAALSIAVGSNPLPLVTVWSALWAPDGSFEATVVASRLPRTQLGILIGAALAVSGCLIQGVTRNALGDPGLLGINSGAAAAVVTLAAVTGISAGPVLTLVAVVGAFVAALAVYAVGSSGRSSTPVRLVLAGAAITAVLGAYIQAVTLINPQVFASYRYWAIGSIVGQHPDTVDLLWPVVTVGLVAACLLGRALNTLSMGEETAVALGARTGRTRLAAALIATILAGVATAAVGPIGFVGLAVPHLVRPFTGSDHRWLLPASAIFGGILLLGADIIGRVIARPSEIAVGIVVAFIGAPFLYAAVRHSRSGL